MRKFLRVFVGNTAVSIAMLFSISGGAYAAASTSAPATNGYRVSPVRTDLNVNAGSSETVNLYVQNASSAVENIQAVANDFEPPTNESGNPALLLNGAKAPTHSLKQFVTIAHPTFSLQPNQTQTVQVVINIPRGTASGGYYGAIRFAPVGATGDKNVNLSASVASLILITVPGNLVQQLSIASFGVSHIGSTKTHGIFLSNKNLQAVIRFSNTGNVQEQPFGNIILKKGSKTLTNTAFNNSSSPSNVLPSSVRLFNVKVNKVGWFGKYTIQGSFGYGSKGQLLTASSTFYVIPVLIIVLVIAVILLILFLIFGLPKMIRSYNKRVIARANSKNKA